MKILAVLVALLCLSATSVSAQTVTSYTVRIYNVGAAAPVSTTVIPAAGFVCGQAKVAAPATVANPSRLAIDDPANAAQDCIYKDTGTGPLLSLPFASTPMNSTITLTNSAGTSPESVASNSFTRPGLPPLAATGLRAAP